MLSLATQLKDGYIIERKQWSRAIKLRHDRFWSQSHFSKISSFKFVKKWEWDQKWTAYPSFMALWTYIDPVILREKNFCHFESCL